MDQQPPTQPSHPCDARVVLRPVRPDDVAVFFRQQLHPEANWMAAFIGADPHDRGTFEARWARILDDDGIVRRAITLGSDAGEAVGYIVRFERDGIPEVTYWLDRAHWGGGVATAALTLFLGELAERPLHARAARDNAASLRVLEKCGFRVVGGARGFARARGAEIDEVLLVLD